VNKISQTISRAFIGNRRTTEFDADIGNAMLLADECVSVLNELVDHYNDDYTSFPILRARLLLKKLEASQ